MVFTARLPDITDADACTILQKYWGLKGTVEFLTSERDQNILVKAFNGMRYLLKISHPDEDRQVSNLQTTALLHIASRDSNLPIPKVLPMLSSKHEAFITLVDGRECLVRLMSFLEGRHISPESVTIAMAESLGENAAQLDIALSDCEHPAGDHDFLWDTRKLSKLSSLLSHIKDIDKRKRIAKYVNQFCNEILPHFNLLSRQLIHNDLNLSNILFSGEHVTGIIDFGDMLFAQRIIDPANLCAYLIQDSIDPFYLGRAAMRRYIEINHLTSEERMILPHLLIGRCLLTILITNWRAALYPEQSGRILRHEARAYGLIQRGDILNSNLTDRFWENNNG
ncbi:MAG: phosphotransferase [Deltaproteobacteria bacterium]|jgi:hydroxylysine kinase|nr:phosphotransferase [Deltaproteobacteria bacterium]